MARSVVVCLSGGVDSAVAGLLLKKQGYDVLGLTFWLWSFPRAPHFAEMTKCCSLDAAALAARELGIPHVTIDASDRFDELVLRDFVDRYRRGETPNPCGRCNRYVRFGLAIDFARRQGIDLIATGHHARLATDTDGGISLLRGADPRKDQSYFLYGLGQETLSSVLFPVGGLEKREVFELAQSEGLTASALPESQDLCFARGGDVSFLFDESDFRPGPIVDASGRELGRHRGLPRYTIGQRKGLGIAAARPLFVIDLDPARNEVVVGPEEALLSGEVAAVDATFSRGRPPDDGAIVDAKLRYRSSACAATYGSAERDSFRLLLQTPQRAVTPGQLAVLYDGERLLGGGTIVRRRDAALPNV